ncbi:plasmid mobilization relaxosome protein MobC [Bartonella apihabitans]|uniref:plasmid mobilization relaxosome protein MobC n=1 Tax=Bartonella apihabitans TaxID=2750929 RepID=UPI0039992262
MASPKDASVYFRLSKTEKETLQNLAISYNCDVSQIIRSLIMTTAGEGPLVDPHISEAINTLCFQLRAIGNNINQLTRAVNTGALIESGDLTEILDNLYATTNALADIYAEIIISAKKRLKGRLDNG